MDELILDVIEEIQQDKADQNIMPTHATRNDIVNKLHVRMKESLNRLCQDKILSHGNTMNDIYFKLNNTNENKIGH